MPHRCSFAEGRKRYMNDDPAARKTMNMNDHQKAEATNLIISLIASDFQASWIIPGQKEGI